MNSMNKYRTPSFVRDWLAIIIILASVVALCIVASIAIATAASGQESKIAQLIFSALLPLFGTWVGTVLAFYFSRENYEVAANFAKETFLSAHERLSSTLVRDAMVPFQQIAAYVLASPNPTTFDGVNLSAVKTAMQQYKRIPVWDDKRKLVAVVHHEPLVSFLFDAGSDNALKQALKNKLPNDVVFGDVKIHRKQLYDQFKQLIAFVPESASLAEAKKEMEGVERCQDVFVTKSGSSKEPVLGWVTNNEIIDRLRV